MTKPKTPRVDQVAAQDAVRAAARRCAVWARDVVAGAEDPRDRAFVEDLILLVRSHESRRPTTEAKRAKGDLDVEQRLAGVIGAFGAIIKARRAKFRYVRPGKVVARQFWRATQYYGFDIPEHVVQQRIAALCRWHDVPSLTKLKDSARDCVAALQLDAGASTRSLYIRGADAAANSRARRQISYAELVMYVLRCLAVGSTAAHVVTEVVVAISSGRRLDPRYFPLRDLIRGIYESPRRKPAYGPSAATPRRAGRTPVGEYRRLVNL